MKSVQTVCDKLIAEKIRFESNTAHASPILASCPSAIKREVSMSNSKKFTPFGLGMAAGAVTISILGLANGWVVSSKASETRIADAHINTQAQVCASLASDHIKGTAVQEDLEGYQSGAREARDKLAKRFAVVLPGQSQVDSRVISACAQMLNKPTG